MAISRVKTWSSGEVLTASDLNAEFNNILNNGSDLVSPFTKAISLGGFALNFDAANTIAATGTTSGILVTGGTIREPVEDTLTAFATGGQTNATALSAAKKFHRISVCATAGDSVKLPSATVGQVHYIRNDGVAFAQAYGTSPDTINGVATGTGVAVPNGSGQWFVCTTAAAWTTPNFGAGNLTGGVNEKLTTVASATTPDIFSLTVGNVVDYTGTATATGFVAAPQAGARRTLVCSGAAVFTAGANMLIDGLASGASYTAIAGDQVKVVAVTTTQFRLSPPNTPFVDTYPMAIGSADGTKKVRLEVDGLTTGTTRVLTVADVDSAIGKQPTFQKLLSGSSATYTTPAGATRIIVTMVGGGGGGGASATNNGTDGTATTFSGFTANGGKGGTASGSGGAGGTATGGDINRSGDNGGPGGNTLASAQVNTGMGGGNPLGSGGIAGFGATGVAALANSGGGGGGGGMNSGAAGGGGGSGGYCMGRINAPAGTYTYTVGAKGTGGASGGFAGADGGTGFIIVDEYYN